LKERKKKRKRAEHSCTDMAGQNMGKKYIIYHHIINMQRYYHCCMVLA
jgi:hypothetical protein